MELRHLRYFVAVAEEKNFTRAAERLCMAQPPLSRQLHQLEEELGVLLFEPGSRPLRLTEAGAFFDVHARSVLSAAADLKSMTQRVGKKHRTLAIGFVASTLYDLLPELVRRFRARYAEVEITFHEMTTMTQLQALKDGRIDVGFGRVEGDDPAIRRIVLSEERLMAAMSKAHPLAAGTAPLMLRELQPETLIVYPNTPRPSFADQVLAIFSQLGLQARKVLEVGELQIALGLAAAGQGVTIVPDGLLTMRRDDITYRPIADRKAVSPVIFSVRRMDRSEELQNMLAMIYAIYDASGRAHVKEAL
ncbi:LysR family transcriptional regulator [Janthinobacterium psychrotolerans]|uniref:DNA-binding transcriptional regulator, LysR family n=1 Tax=Janthinobacterium psychrotolerans TaxID=1747903 RepID=A0A1A7C0Q8_9BURK|nr:LysR family transcriptional regulator [Janthinobacterium psychrotolerans]OBV38589.1 DNA-binding transcriptional regulator, LysR family [Janthinobacterium psychrotolerans]